MKKKIFLMLSMAVAAMQAKAMPDIVPDMVTVQGGTFQMGCTPEQDADCEGDERPVHAVTVGTFKLAKCEVTQAQWRAVMGTSVGQQRDSAERHDGKTGYPLVGEGDGYPMYYVSWEEAQEFIRRLNAATGRRFRLPTEAEWEFAARGGNLGKGYKYSGSNDLNAVGWYVGNSDSAAHPVGRLQPNELGLFDMTGNVWEYCSDWYGKYSDAPQVDPQGAPSGNRHVRRGGSWDIRRVYQFVANRSRSAAGARNSFVGFRLAESCDSAYLMVYFTDPTHSLFFAVSRDGYTFTAVNDGKPVIGGDSIAEQRGIRDPYIMRGADGYFYMAMTDLHVFGRQAGIRTTEWERPKEQYGWGNNRGLVLLKSPDLIHWTHTVFDLQKAYPHLDVACAWAPEMIYDERAGKIMLYFTMRRGNGKTKLYYAYMNRDFTAFEAEPKVLFDYPDSTKQILDADITRLPDGRYVMCYVAQENPAGIKVAFSDSIHSGYVYRPEQVDFEPRSCEAPNVWRRTGTDRWVLMYDIFSIRPHNFGFAETSDFITFTHLGRFNEGAMKTTNFTSPKHGAVIPITDAEATRLEQMKN